MQKRQWQQSMDDRRNFTVNDWIKKKQFGTRSTEKSHINVE